MLLDVPVKEGSFVIQSNAFNEGTTITNREYMIFEGKWTNPKWVKLKEGIPLELHLADLLLVLL